MMLLLMACTAGDEPRSVFRDLDPARIDRVQDIVLWANEASAAAVATTAALAVFFADSFAQADCPGAGDGVIQADGCEDDSGWIWEGSGEVVLDTANPEEPATAELDLTRTRPGQCADTPDVGVFKGWVLASPDFEMDLVVSADIYDADCQAMTDESATRAWDYRGTSVESGSNTTFNGEGTLAITPEGVLDAQTVDQVMHSDCGYEAWSGQTTLSAGGDEAVITYDGSTDCDTGATATWSYNGQDQGEVRGIQCGPGVGGGLALTALGALLLGRRQG